MQEVYAMNTVKTQNSNHADGNISEKHSHFSQHEIQQCKFITNFPLLKDKRGARNPLSHLYQYFPIHLTVKIASTFSRYNLDECDIFC